jgi:WD40 repeat protein
MCLFQRALTTASQTSALGVQEYHYHLGAVNTISYIEEGRLFATTSDDKTIRVWELGVPVQVKVIADPSMHSMPAAAYHPTGKFLCYQSLDSTIVTYACTGKFRLNKKKIFKGHLVGGNACAVRPMCTSVAWCLDAECRLRAMGVATSFVYLSLMPSRLSMFVQGRMCRLCGSGGHGQQVHKCACLFEAASGNTINTCGKHDLPPPIEDEEGMIR